MSPARRIRHYLGIALVLLASAAEAQPRRFSEKIEVRIVQIDVVVTDHGGNRVHGLTADDFEVLEGRTPQQITNFTEYRAAAVETTTPAPSAVPQSSPAREPHTLLVLLDSLPRTGFVRERVFADLESLLAKAIHDGDRAGIVFWDPAYERPLTICELSSNADAVKRAIRQLAGKVTTSGWEEAAAEYARAEGEFWDEGAAAGAQSGKGAIVDTGAQKAASEIFRGETELMFFRRKTFAIRRLMTVLGAAPGRKTLLYVSIRFSFPAEEGARAAAVILLDDLVRTANAAGVTIYAVRPAMPDDHSNPLAARSFQQMQGMRDSARGAFDRGMDALNRVTVPTGGLVDFGPHSVDTLGEKLSGDLDSYYSIAYQAKSDGADRERSILVRAKNRSYTVRTRQAIVEKSNETLARDALLTRLFTRQQRDDLTFEVEQGTPRRSGRDRWLLPIVLKIPGSQLRFASESGSEVARVKILIQAANGIAEVTNVNEHDLRVAVPKEQTSTVLSYSAEILCDGRGSMVSIGVLDRSSGFIGVRMIDTRGRFK